MTDFNTWNEDTIRVVQEHLGTQMPVGDYAEFQYIIDALDSLTDDEIKVGFVKSVDKIREIPEMLRAGKYKKAYALLGKAVECYLPHRDGFWFKAYDAVGDKSREE